VNQQQLIERIHTSGNQLVLSITGGGSGAIGALLEVPGASASVLEVVVPYAAAALDKWLGGMPDNYCSESTARAMAMAAFERARELSDADPCSLRGIGAAASLVSNRPKRGPHRIHVAWQSADTTAVESCELKKGVRSRAQEEQVAATLVLNAVAGACGLDDRLAVGEADETVSRREQRAPTAWTELLLGQRSHVAVNFDGESDRQLAAVLFPGAFHPIHRAHEHMAEIAAETLGRPVKFELSTTNVDKPPLDFVEIADRLMQFEGRHVLLTRAPRFVDKARIAPGCTFVVGVDTMIRIGEAKYYDGDDAARDAAIAEIARAGCRFLVFGRKVQDGFCTLSALRVPTALRALCDEVPESVFRDDISSTELRGA
jgi:nicotinamide mononucleotide (NMN) deamidase PncC